MVVVEVTERRLIWQVAIDFALWVVFIICHVIKLNMKFCVIIFFGLKECVKNKLCINKLF